MKIIHYITGIIFGLVLPFISFGATYDMYHSQQAFPASLPLGVYSRNDSNYLTATALRFNHFTRSNVDITSILHNIQSGDIIKIIDSTGNYYTWLVTGLPTHFTSYENVPVSFITLSGSDTTFNGYGANVDIDFNYQPPLPPPAITGLFHIRNPITNEPSNSATDLVASVGVVSGDVFNNALPFMFLAVGIGVAFYIAQSLKKVIPKDKKNTMKTYDIVGESSGGVVHTTFRERKKDL